MVLRSKGCAYLHSKTGTWLIAAIPLLLLVVSNAKTANTTECGPCEDSLETTFQDGDCDDQWAGQCDQSEAGCIRTVTSRWWCLNQNPSADCDGATDTISVSVFLCDEISPQNPFCHCKYQSMWDAGIVECK